MRYVFQPMAMHDRTQCEIGYGELPRSRRKQQLSTLNARHFLQQRQCLIAQRDSVLYVRFHALLWDSKNFSRHQRPALAHWRQPHIQPEAHSAALFSGLVSRLA